MFLRYTLRTTDPDAARRFYQEAIGLELPRGASEAAGGSRLECWPLHERALRAGAPPHWLGHLGVPDLEAALRQVVAQGAQPLGPVPRGPVVRAEGGSWARIRDPLGAILALRQRSSSPEDGEPTDRPVCWHQLHTTDLERSWSFYEELTGWAEAGRIEAPDPEGGHRLFAWSAGEPAVGSAANTARWEGVHPQWLFHFPIADVEAAVARVRALGGFAFEPVSLPDGSRLAACDDPQGGAFGLLQAP